MKELSTYLKQNRRFSLAYIEQKYLTQEVKDVLARYNFSLHELCYRLTHSIPLDKIFKCPVCNELIHFNGRGYNNTCSMRCGRLHCIDKTKKTNLKKYGVENVFQADIIKDKIHKTNIIKYGKPVYTQTNAYRDKYKQACLKKYGVEHAFQSNIIKSKIRQTTIKKYSKESFTQTEEYKVKSKNTSLKKYGVDNFNKKHFKNTDLLTEEYCREHFIKDGFFHIQEFSDFFNMQIDIAHKHYKKLFNIIEPNKQMHLREQIEVYDFIKSIYTYDIQLNTRQIIPPREIDIYIPEKNLAIEFDGLMFHSYGQSDKTMFNNSLKEDHKYHLSKTLECEKKGIQLLHIFENEWLYKKDIWKSIIINKLGLSTRIYARKCVIREVNYNEVSTFLQLNHLQGSCVSKVNIGLYYNNELVSLMTFGKSRYNKNYNWELLRFCNKNNITVVGAASRLLKYFRSKYNGSIISYANRRWSNGNLYKQLGFVLTGNSEPNYYYFTETDKILYSRVKFQKHKLKNTLTIFDPKASETQNMYNNNYRKIYDCGNLIFTLK